MSVLQRLRQTAGPVDAAAVAELRRVIPEPVLAHFDRQLARGKKAVAEARRGVCGACHLRLPAATVAAPAAVGELALCESCGAYLIFPPEDVSAPVPAVRPRRRPQAVAVG